MARNVVFISAASTEAVLDWPSMINGLRRAYSVPHQSHTSYRAVARGEGVWLRSLVSVPPTSELMGAKIFGRTARRQVTYLVPLFDQASSELVALVDGRHLTARLFGHGRYPANCRPGKSVSILTKATTISEGR